MQTSPIIRGEASVDVLLIISFMEALSAFFEGCFLMGFTLAMVFRGTALN